MRMGLAASEKGTHFSERLRHDVDFACQSSPIMTFLISSAYLISFPKKGKTDTELRTKLNDVR